MSQKPNPKDFGRIQRGRRCRLHSCCRRTLARERARISKNRTAEGRALEALKELHRMRECAISVAAQSNTPESAKQQRIEKGSPYWTLAYSDVCAAVDREMALWKELKAAQEMASAAHAQVIAPKIMESEFRQLGEEMGAKLTETAAESLGAIRRLAQIANKQGASFSGGMVSCRYCCLAWRHEAPETETHEAWCALGAYRRLVR